MLEPRRKPCSTAGSAGVESLSTLSVAFVALLSVVALGASFRTTLVEQVDANDAGASEAGLDHAGSSGAPMVGARQQAAGLRPILALVDGFSSSDRMFGFSADVVSELRRLGYDARRIEVGPYASTQTNAEVLRVALAELAQEGRPVHAIAHSKGGVDLVTAAADPLDGLRSVTTIASPHRGTSLIAPVHMLFQTPVLGKALSALLRRPLQLLQRHGLGNASGVGADLRGVVAGMIENDGSAIRLNPSVHYRTVAGYSGNARKYQRAYQAEFGPFLNPTPTRSWINRVTSKFMAGPEDGVVTLASSRLPDAPNVAHLGTFHGDHLNQVSDRQIVEVITQHVLPTLNFDEVSAARR